MCSPLKASWISKSTQVEKDSASSSPPMIEEAADAQESRVSFRGVLYERRRSGARGGAPAWVASAIRKGDQAREESGAAAMADEEPEGRWM